MSEKAQNETGLLSSLQSLGLTEYESRAYLSLLSLGVSDARQLCLQSGVPSSKIYAILEKFELMGIIDVQQSKPAKFKALDPSLGLQRLINKKEKEIVSIRDTLPILESELEKVFSASPGADERPFFNLQFGMKDHIQKHLPHLANARKEILSYFETTCLQGAKIYGRGIKRDIVGNIMRNNIHSRIIFGTMDKKLVEGFLRGLPDSANIESRHARQIHAPFHVIDMKSSIVVVDNPLLSNGRIASLHVTDAGLAKELAEGYRALWDSAKGV